MTSAVRRAAEAAAVWAAAFAVLLLGVGRSLIAFDEAWPMVAAERIRAGELPFRDFYALYPPGQYYAVAGLFEAFGADAMTVRVWCIALRAGIALAIYLVARRLAGRQLAACAAGAALLWLLACGHFGYPVFPALLLALTALLALAGCADGAARGEPAGRARLFAAGAAVGATALFRHDVGAYAALACVPLGVRASAGRFAAAATTFLAGVAVTFGVPALWLLARVPLGDVVFELFTYPATSYSAMRGLPYPPLLVTSGGSLNVAGSVGNAMYYAPWAFGAAGIAWVVGRRRSGKDDASSADTALLLGVAMLTLALMNSARVRTVTIQVCGAVTVSFALAAGLARRAWDARTTAGRVAAFATAAAALAALVWPLHALKQVPLSGPVRSGPDPQRVSGLEAGNARRAAAAYLASVVPPDGRVFVACGRHDKVFTNEPMIYFLADRLPGSRWHCFDPGVITTRPVQEEATRDLARHRVEYVAVSTAFDDVREPNGSAVPDGATVLDEYLRTNYAEDRRFSPVLSVWKRRTPFEAAEGR